LPLEIVKYFTTFVYSLIALTSLFALVSLIVCYLFSYFTSKTENFYIHYHKVSILFLIFNLFVVLYFCLSNVEVACAMESQGVNTNVQDNMYTPPQEIHNGILPIDSVPNVQQHASTFIFSTVSSVVSTVLSGLILKYIKSL